MIIHENIESIVKKNRKIDLKYFFYRTFLKQKKRIYK